MAAITEWDGLHLKWSRPSEKFGIVIKDVNQVVNFTQVSFLLARFDRKLGPIYQINTIILRSDSCTVQRHILRRVVAKSNEGESFSSEKNHPRSL